LTARKACQTALRHAAKDASVKDIASHSEKVDGMIKPIQNHEEELYEATRS
jgi:hypothetical protein